MKILMVDKYYFVKGGAERYLFELKDVLEANGHTVIPFSMKHPDNFETRYDEYFVDNIDYNLESFSEKLIHLPRITGRMLYSLHARRKLEALLRREKPDIAHLHMIDHQLSPSILHSLKKYHVPVVQTVHQYKLVCPNYRLYNPRTNQICEKCLGGGFYHPIVERCHKDSALAGAMIAVESYLHQMLRIYSANVDIFHTPSHFMTSKLKASGVGDEKIRHLFYTLKLDNYQPEFRFGGYILYLGRLAREKGVLTLLRAMEKTGDVILRVVGDGPERPMLEAFVEERGLRNVEFCGNKSGAELSALVRNSRFLVVPSEWYDNSPLVIYEAFAYGKPVIGSNLGGIPELIDDNKNGLHFHAGDVEELAEKIRYLNARPKLIQEFGKCARQKAERVFGPEYHYNQVYGWYRELLGRFNGRQ